MNAKSLKVAVLVALVAVFVSAFNVFAYPAEQPDMTPVQPDPCLVATTALSQMDIPSRRADYNLLNYVVQCTTSALDINGVIPVTGTQNNRFMQVKDLQAELASGSEKYTRNTSKVIPFAEFKEQQADQKSN